MILLLDIGNSRIKYALLVRGEVISGAVARHGDAGAVERLLAGVRKKPEVIYLISVVGEEIESRVTEWCRRHWGVGIVRLTSQAQCSGVTNGYNAPGRLGVDRWAAIVGAYHRVKQAVLVVDCGTVCTADLVDDKGQHWGGAITPGLTMLRQSLYSGAAGIAQAEADAEGGATFGTSTETCIDFGVAEGMLGFVERMRRHAASVLGEEVMVLLTGGDAPYLLPRLKHEVQYEKELVFLGMAVMATESEK